jgi:osmotically-inducible protein OsmY
MSLYLEVMRMINKLIKFFDKIGTPMHVAPLRQVKNVTFFHNRPTPQKCAMFQTPKRWMPLARLLLALSVAASVQGCAEAIVGTAVVGAIAANDRRTLGAQTDDKAITLKAETHIPALIGEAGHVNIASFNRKVLLTGEVRNEDIKTLVERDTANIQGVQSVVNELEIADRSNYTSRGNDALLTGKVKASFIDTKELSATAIKVVTERETVYLMGRVTQLEGQRAAEVARGVTGVKRIVKVFDYINEDELRDIDKRS